MSKRYSITDLILYYADRYSLPKDKGSKSHETDKHGIAAYKQAITGMMKKTLIDDEKSYWDLSKPKEGVRTVTVEEFEGYCFPAWCAYLEKNYAGVYDKVALQADKDRYAEKMKYVTAAKEAIQAQNDALKAGIYLSEPVYEPTSRGNYVDEDLVTRRGLNMMIEAIYDDIFENFDWDALRADMETAEMPDGSMYNPEITPDMMEAQARLSDYHNYIGKKRK